MGTTHRVSLVNLPSGRQTVRLERVHRIVDDIPMYITYSPMNPMNERRLGIAESITITRERFRVMDMQNTPDVEVLNMLLQDAQRLENREGAYKFLRELKEYGYRVVWRLHNETGKGKLVISKPKGLWVSFPRSIPDTLAWVLEINSNEAWEVEKARVDP